MAHRSKLGASWSRALVTGASSGIGEAFAQLLAAQGIHLVLVARNVAKLEALADELRGRNVEVEVLAADLSDRAQLQTVVDRLLCVAGEAPIDLLINNAGFGYVGDFLALDPIEDSSVIDVNVSALHRLAHAAGSTMASRGKGWILNVSSVAGFAPSPQSATYAATKAFVTSLSEALYIELGPQGVMVSCLCPGLTRTNFHERAGLSGVDDRLNGLWQSANDVAEAGLKGLANGNPVVVPGVHNKVARSFTKLAPQPVVRGAAKMLTRFRR